MGGGESAERIGGEFLSDYLVTDTELTGIANAIRSKGGTSASLEFPGDFVDAIDDISTGTDTSDATATAADILAGKTAYIATGKATGTIPEKDSTDLTASGDTVTVPAGHYASAASKAVAAGSISLVGASKGRVTDHSINVQPYVNIVGGYLPSGQTSGNAATVAASELVSGTKVITGSGTTDVTNYAEASVAAGSASTPATSVTANPSISVSSGGLITASVSASQSVTPSVSAGWVSSGTAGTVSVSGSNTQQLSTQAAQTITPGTTDQTIAAGKYLTGAQTILGDANLVAANIAKDVSIFGVTGTHEGGGSADFACGTFTPADATSDIVITHGLGHKPYFFCISCATDGNSAYSGSTPKGLATFVGTAYKYRNSTYYGMRHQSYGTANDYDSGAQSSSEGNWSGAWYKIHISSEAITLRQANLGRYGCGTGCTFFWLAYGNVGDVI